MSAIDFILYLLMMNTTNTNNLNKSPNTLNESVLALQEISKELVDALERSPAQVTGFTLALAERFVHAEDFLMTDKVLTLFNQMKKHLTNIHNAIQTGELYDSETVTTYAQTENLTTALFEQKDLLTAKRLDDNYLNQTYGFVINEINGQIQKILDNTPVLLSKTA